MKRGLVAVLIVMIASAALPTRAQDGNARPVVTPENAHQLAVVATLGRGTVQDVAWSPDDTSIAIATPGGVWLYDPDDLNAEPRFLAADRDWLHAIAYSPDGARIVASGANGQIYLWDVRTGDRVAVLEAGVGVWRLAFSPDGARLAAFVFDLPLFENNSLQVWSVSDPANIASVVSFPIEGALNWGLAYSPDGEIIATGGKQSIILWDTTTWTTRTIPSKIQIIDLAFHPDGKTLAVATNPTLQLYDMDTLAELETVKGVFRPVDVDYSVDGRFLAVGYLNGTIYDTTYYSVVLEITYPVVTVNVALSPDGSKLLTESIDSGIRLWDVQTREQRASIAGYVGRIKAIDFAPTGQLAIGTNAGILSLWEPLTDQAPTQIGSHYKYISGIAFNEDGTRIVSTTSSLDDVHIWDVATGQELRTLSAEIPYFSSLALTRDGKTVAAGTENYGTITIWDVESGEIVHSIQAHAATVSNLAFSPDGSLLASSSLDETLNVWDVATGEQRATVYIIDGAEALAWSPDGRELSIGAFGGSGIITWATDQLNGRLDVADSLRYIDHPGGTHTLAYSPDGRLIATGGADGIVRVWGIP